MLSHRHLVTWFLCKNVSTHYASLSVTVNLAALTSKNASHTVMTCSYLFSFTRILISLCIDFEGIQKLLRALSERIILWYFPLFLDTKITQFYQNNLNIWKLCICQQWIIGKYECSRKWVTYNNRSRKFSKFCKLVFWLFFLRLEIS